MIEFLFAKSLLVWQAGDTCVVTLAPREAGRERLKEGRLMKNKGGQKQVDEEKKRTNFVNSD